MRRLAIAALALLGLTTAAFAFDDTDALKGLKEGKIAFDLTEGSGKGLLNRLDIIDETRQSLIKQGVTPHFVIVFRGPATKLVQTDIDKIAPDDRDTAAKIAVKLKGMRGEQGVDGLEQCSVAVREQGTDPAKVVPSVKVVGNVFISLMAYQQKGYAYVRP
jgi:intracellular sulfur oxidation DsrE/DsrF family protein